MSNFVVSDQHIQSLANYFVVNSPNRLGGRTYADRVGNTFEVETEKGHLQLCRELIQGNIESQAIRYPNQLKFSAYAQVSRCRNHVHLTAVEAIKLSECLSYNSCEGLNDHDVPDSAKSAMNYTRDFCRKVQSVAHSKLDGYDAAPWEI